MSSPAEQVQPEEASPAQRYRAARARAQLERTAFGAFRELYPFELDPFQERACRALEEGRGVLVAAPTGSGKTVVGEFAVHLALSTGRKAFYTTPIKALSNQKYADLVARHGAANVGLLTGDTSVNGEAPVVVMTTEVLRNMLYGGSSTVQGLGYVVMDEVHYLADRFRGPVWEEVILHLPEDVLVVSLSATVSNAEEFGAWLDTVRGHTEVVVSEHRPVPLWQHVMVGSRLLDLFTGPDGFSTAGPGAAQDARGAGRLQVPAGSTRPAVPRVNPELRRLGQRQSRSGPPGRRGASRTGRDRPRRWTPPPRPEVLAGLDRAGLLPAIFFIFSRAGCEAALRQCLAHDVRLTTAAERDRIRLTVARRCVDLPPDDLGVLGFDTFAEALERGVAAHHAGMLPTFKEVVEELFAQGLIKAVFATETLALGVNMPARSVVLERLVKWNGQTHADVTPGEYTQLTGRAGRRGIDVEGHGVVLWNPDLDPDVLAGLASRRTYPLRSSFRPTYNMAVNLVGQVGRDRAREVLEMSFAQFQADRAVVGLAREARKQEEALEGYSEAMTCHLGDFGEYAALRRRISERESRLARGTAHQRREEAAASLEGLRRGDVVRVPGGRLHGWMVVTEAGSGVDPAGPRPTVLTAEGKSRRLSTVDVHSVLEPVTRITVPKGFSSRDARARRDLASSLRTALENADLPHPRGRGQTLGEDDAELAALRRALRAHPCHGCADREDHARWAERWHRLRAEHETLIRRIEGRTSTVARAFDRVCDLLTERGYLAGDAVTEHGRRLARIYAEADLLVAECLREGAWDGLDAAGLAACASAVVYQSRRDDAPVEPKLAGGAPVRTALARTVAIWSQLEDRERELRLEGSPEPDLGLAWAVHRWADGARLSDVLRGAELEAGDFVRWCKQVIDLLGQIEQVGSRSGDQRLRQTAAQAIDGVRRGVVAYSSVT